ncbi:MAG: glycosyltransferase family 4 protein [Nitrospiraceae bacterium]|nr:glycosyltransferase family 4 protein [Nitrospiraceae bacterium]
MKVLILNRRDPANPAAGGAEVYTHEIARGLTQRGCQVTVLASGFKGCEPRRLIDGVEYLRRGNEFTVHFIGFAHAVKNRAAYNLIIDEFNGMGFFCFLLPNSALLIHQMYRQFWFKELGPAGVLPYVLEPFALCLYRKRPVVTVSQSTRADLERLGFKNVRIVMNALNIKPPDTVPAKEPRPTLVFLGRFRSTKRPDHAIRIFARVKKEAPDAQLWMIGSGGMEHELKLLASGVGDVSFLGWLNEDEKYARLGRAHVLIVPSVREGFGINVIEAASQGTPAVGYDVHGLRDSIKDGATGLLAKSEEDAAAKIISLFKDKEQYARLSSNCLEYARGFNWDTRRKEFCRFLEESFPVVKFQG